MGIKSVQNVNLHDDRIGEERCNKSGCLMKIIEYNGNNDLIVEFQDEYHYLVHTDYKSFKNGSVRNPYHPKIYGVAATGSKYKTRYGNETTKEYLAWYDMLRRCFDKKYKKIFQHIRMLRFVKSGCCLKISMSGYMNKIILING